MLDRTLRIIGSWPVIGMGLTVGTTLHPIVAVPCAMGFYVFLMVSIYRMMRPLPDT